MQRTIKLPAAVSSAADLDELIKQLQALKAELAYYEEVDIQLRWE